jgi:hypothetical protein
LGGGENIAAKTKTKAKTTASKIADSGTAMFTRAESKAEGVLTTEDLSEYPAPLFSSGDGTPDETNEGAE